MCLVCYLKKFDQFHNLKIKSVDQCKQHLDKRSCS